MTSVQKSVFRGPVSPIAIAGLPDWSGRIGTLDDELEFGRSRLFDRSSKTHFRDVRKQLETFEFREPYQIGEVQSFGEKWAFWR